MADFIDKEFEEIFGKFEKPSDADIDLESQESDQKDYNEMISKGLESAYATTGYTENW